MILMTAGCDVVLYAMLVDRSNYFMQNHSLRLMMLIFKKYIFTTFTVNSQKVEVEKMGLQHSPRCCFYRASGCEFVIQEGRVRIESHPVSHVTKDVLKCTICLKAELLSIGGCANLGSIDVPDLLNLKMLEVAGGCPQLRRIKLEGAANLQYLIWLDFVGEFPNLTSLESLEELWLQSYEEVSAPSWKGSLHLSRSSNLETLVLPGLPLRLLNLNGAAKRVNCHELHVS